MRGRRNLHGGFITLEGGEGAGKTSVIEVVEKRLIEQGYDVLITREPGGIRISEAIREIILHQEHKEMEERTEALLYAAARRQHLIERIIPSLKAGKIVLCDRFIDSSLAYQGYARGIGIDRVQQINAFAIDDWMPSLTLFLDITPEVGLQRINNDINREKNRLDLEKVGFHHKVYEGYHVLLEMFPERIRTIDAEQNLDYVAESVYQEIIKHLKERKWGK